MIFETILIGYQLDSTRDISIVLSHDLKYKKLLLLANC